MIVFADLHLQDSSESVVFNEVLPFVLDLARQDPDRKIAFLGDWWHKRHQISVRLQNLTADFLSQLNSEKIWMIILPGNHDQINSAGENALEVFSRYPMVQVFTEPCWDSNGLWVPYRKNREDIQKALGTMNVLNAPPVLWTHHGIQSAWMNNSRRDTEGLPLGMFRGWHVFCGHYHMPQQIENICYIGSPYQTNVSEAGQQKRIGVFNWATANKIDFIPVNFGKKYHTAELVDINDVKKLDIKSGDEIRLVVDDSVDVNVLHNYLSESGVDHVITQKSTATEQRLAVSLNASLQDYVDAYVSQFSGSLSNGALLEVYQEIVS